MFMSPRSTVDARSAGATTLATFLLRISATLAVAAQDVLLLPDVINPSTDAKMPRDIAATNDRFIDICSVVGKKLRSIEAELIVALLCLGRDSKICARPPPAAKR